MKKIILSVFSLFLVSFLFSEDLIMEIKPNPLGRGDKFTVELFVEYEDVAGVSVVPPVMPEGVRLSRGPYFRSYWLETKNGEKRKKTMVSYTYSASKTGRFVIDPFVVTMGDKIVKTGPVLLRVGLYKNRKLFIPYNIKWVTGSGPFYEGMAIPLILEVHDLEEVMPFEEVAITNLKKGLSEPLRDTGEITERDFGDFSLFTVPVSGIIFTPTSSGRIQIPTASVVARDIKSVTESSFISVLKIPEPVRATGAVGVFEVKSWIENPEPLRNEKIIVHFKISGDGNLNYFQIPQPAGSGLTLVNSEDLSDYHTSGKGFSGTRELVFSFISDSAGDGILTVPPFPFINTETGSVDYGEESVILYTVASDTAEYSESELEEEFPFSPVKSGAESFRSMSRYKDPSSYLWLLPGPLVFLIFLFAGKKKIIIGASIIFISVTGAADTIAPFDSGLDKYNEGSYEDAIELFLSAKEEYPDNPNISYNLSLAYYQTDAKGLAVYEARNAYYHDPVNKKYRELIQYLESWAGVSFPVNPSFNLYPDLFLFLLMILVNLASFSGVVYLIKHKNFFFILSILLLSLSFVSAGGLIFSILEKSRIVGVVTTDLVDVKKIPDYESENVVSIRSGDSVIVKGASEDFLYITTGAGIKGWIAKDELSLVED